MGDIPYGSALGPDHGGSSPQGDGIAGEPPAYEEQQSHQKHDLAYQTSQYPQVSQHAFTSQFDMAQSSPGARQDAYNMAPIASSLPQLGYRPGNYSYGHGPQQRYNSSSPSMMQHMPQYAGHPQLPMQTHGYYVQQPQIPQFYAGQFSPTQTTSAMPSRASRPNTTYYSNQPIMNHSQSTYYYPQTPQYPTSVHPQPNTIAHGQYVTGSPVTTSHRPMSRASGNFGSRSVASSQGQDGVDKRQNTVRGPPRKPRQSGHAIWIGNLPPQTDLMSLVHHVCKEASGLESLFLISKSNCAFANFKDEKACIAAQQKLHDSKFQTVRLVSRLRKSTVEGATGVTAPTGPALSTIGPPTQNDEQQETTPHDIGDVEDTSPASEQSGLAKPGVDGEVTSQKDKFFILKSLTVEDLDLSVRTGIWATQSHNEEALNNAFKTVDNVYLVFSANKSGEYFGYAHMTSNINEDPAAAIEFAPKAQATSDLDLPKAISTDATEFAPRGRIIDDSARGTIFWEAEGNDSEDNSDSESDASSGKSTGAEEETAKTWGKPFSLEWLSTTRLPFYRTRGLRNPWNSNREVKIARDGTELEPSVGRRLIGLFNRVQNPPPMRVPIPMLPGFQIGSYGQ
ncbi:hypothetical protein G7046_g7494 [Stylonectria norvegica]|nr:hypothetical protein G7046_g7494 [Stylonectria norvegica]